MSELNKSQLSAENQSSFPNNNTGYITPEILRTFNQNMIDSLVDEVSYNSDSASFSASIAEISSSMTVPGVIVQEEGSTLGQATTLDFVGNVVTASFSSGVATIEINASSISGTSGTSGTNGTSGVDGTNGTAGTSGADGTNGTNGIDGTNGTAGTSGNDGTSGVDGSSGTSGNDGTSGVDGSSGTSGADGTNGTDGVDGSSGTSGNDGTSGVDGSSGTSGIDGTNGTDGVDGSSGTSGIDGTNGTNGVDGSSGTSGVDGTNGTAGTSGVSPLLSPYTGSVDILGNVNINGTLTVNEIYTQYESSSIIYSSGSTKFGDTLDDTHQFTGSVSITGSLTVTDSVTLKSGSLSGSFVDNITDSYTEVPRVEHIVTLDSGSYNSLGTKDPNTLYIITGSAFQNGTSGTSGVNGTSGINGTSGLDGTNGTAGSGGTSGINGVSGTSGTSGIDGVAGTSGTSGIDGVAGTSGTSGIDGVAGTSGTSGVDGTNGTAGTGGTSGTSGATTILTIEKDDVEIGPASSLNFTGSAVTVTDAGGGQIDVEINVTGGTGAGFPFTGSAEITGSLIVTGSIYSDSEAYLTASWALNTLSSSLSVYAQNTIVYGKNVSGGTIEKGTPLYFTGSGASGNIVGVWPADAGNPARMPAGGIAGEQMLDEAEGIVLIDGFINGVDTSAFESGDEVFVGVGGGYTNVPPTGSANLIQKLGNVEKVDGSNGSGVINGPGAARSVPNIQQGYSWVGDGDDVAQPTSTSSFFVNSASLAQETILVKSGDGTFDYDGYMTFFASTQTEGQTLYKDTTGGLKYNPNQNKLTLTGSFDVTGSITVVSQSFTGSVVDNVTPTYYDVPKVKHIVTLDSASYAGLGTKDPNTLYVVSGSGVGAYAITASYALTALSSSYSSTSLSSSYALTASYALNGGGGGGFPYTGSAEITGSLGVTGSIKVVSGSYTGSVIDNVTPSYGGVPEVKHVVSITSASYSALGTKDPNTLYVVSGSSAGLASEFPYTGSAQITGSLGITGSLKGNYVNMSITSNTASMDVNAGNFFVLQLVSGNTHITATNVQGSQTTNLLLKSVSGATVTFGPNILQPSSYFFTASSATAEDVLTFVAFDTTSLYMVGQNNFI